MKQTAIFPRPHFSYSQYNLWITNKDQYREKYYENKPDAFVSKELIFGKKIARMLESGKKNTVLDKVPRYAIMEQSIEQEIGGYPFLGYFDSFDPKKKSILEFKTGREPWTQTRVQKHDQLAVYSLLCKLAYKKVDPIVKLIWLETRNKETQMRVGDYLLKGDVGEIEFTGNIKIFERTITEVERDKMKKKIIRALWEIMNDYREYKKNK